MGFWGGTALFIALEVAFVLWVRFTGGSRTNNSLHYLLYSTSVFCCWMMWALVHVAQTHPLVSPVLVQREV